MRRSFPTSVLVPPPSRSQTAGVVPLGPTTNGRPLLMIPPRETSVPPLNSKKPWKLVRSNWSTSINPALRTFVPRRTPRAAVPRAFDWRRGTNVLNAGLIDVDQLLLTNFQGFFEFNGGTLVSRGGIISNGLPFVVGPSGTTPPAWDLVGGGTNTLVGNDLLIGSNASFNQLIQIGK